MAEREGAGLDGVTMTPAQLAALDQWREERAASLAHPERLSRGEAVARLAADTLIQMGMLDPKEG